jgi:hypothetical protein
MNPAISEIDLKAGFVDTDLEAGKKCPKGKHMSWRTKSGMNRKTPRCVKHRRTRSGRKKRHSPMPKYFRHKAGRASSPGRGRCSRNYYRTKSGRCRRRRLSGGEEFEGGEFEGEFEGGMAPEVKFEGGAAHGAAPTSAQFEGGSHGQQMEAREVLGGLVADAMDGEIDGGMRRPRGLARCPMGKVRSYRDSRGNHYRTGPRCVSRSRRGRRGTSPYSSKRHRKCKRGSARSQKTGRCHKIRA